MAETPKTSRRRGGGVDGRQPPLSLLPVCDTVSGHKATDDPAGVVRHYRRLADQLWLPPRVRELAGGVFAEVRTGRTRWASISGPYGYGKTAAGVMVWRHAEDQGFTAIPPLSCSNFDEFAQGVAALASALHPEGRARIERLFRRVWDRGINEEAHGDARRYRLPARAVRRLLKDKLQAGQLSLDGQCHRLVEFLSELGRLATRWSHGLVVVLDELQQLLGPLDTRSVIQFREFVWGMRTEQSPCGVVVCLDAMLEARLARWAADLLHRIRESGPTLQLTEVYTREFPGWLWGQLTTSNGVPARADGRSVTREVLLSLGQFVERPDLANGPRTVVDVFCRAIGRFGETRTPYGVGDLVTDLHRGVFRYFGEGAPVQRVLADLLRDDWVLADEDRAALVRTLAAFPRGCPAEVAAEALGSAKRLARVRADLFGPLLVELPEGLALERLQQVRRLIADWEHVLARCWDTLPAQDSLLAHTPDMIWRVLGTRLFPEAPGSEAHWERTSDDSVAALTGWRFLRGSYDDDFPLRDVGVWTGTGTPADWPQDVDLAIALVGDQSAAGEASASFETDGAVPRLTLRLPLLRVLEFVPSELERYRKYLSPEPFRPLTVLAAVHELEAVAGRAADDGVMEGAAKEPGSFVEITVEFLIRELLQGEVNLGPRERVKQRGIELIRALFSAACRRKFPGYRTLLTHHNWADFVAGYRAALRSETLSDLQRQGRAAVEGTKAALLRDLFGQKSTAAGDSLLRVLGPLVEWSGTADAFSLRFTLHPGETAALEYLRKAGRRRPVPVGAVQETLRHAGYLPAEADAVVGLLTDRGLLTQVAGGVRPLLADPSEREAALREIDAVAARLRPLTGECGVPAAPESGSLRDLWAHLDRLRQLLTEAVRASAGEVERQGQTLRDLLGAVRAESVPGDWTDSGLAAHLRGIAKLLGRTKESLLRTLERELGRAEEELARAAAEAEDWAVAWRKRRPSFDRIWRELEDRVTQFRGQAASLRAWLPVNDRLASLAALGAKVGQSDPALARTVAGLSAELRERFATDSWAPVHAHAEVAARLTALEAQVQGLLFSRVQAYLGELDALRVRFNDFLTGPAPQIDATAERSGAAAAPPFARLYAWATQNFAAAVDRLRARRSRGHVWRHPTRKSQGWSDIDGQVSRALEAARNTADFRVVTRLGELLLLMRQGFITAAGDRGECVYEGAECAADLPELSSLLADGRVRVRVEWVQPQEGGRRQG
jgi:hypothetical protein